MTSYTIITQRAQSLQESGMCRGSRGDYESCRHRSSNQRHPNYREVRSQSGSAWGLPISETV